MLFLHFTVVSLKRLMTGSEGWLMPREGHNACLSEPRLAIDPDQLTLAENFFESRFESASQIGPDNQHAVSGQHQSNRNARNPIGTEIATATVCP